jgi:hypothetical protein
MIHPFSSIVLQRQSRSRKPVRLSLDTRFREAGPSSSCRSRTSTTTAVSSSFTDICVCLGGSRAHIAGIYEYFAQLTKIYRNLGVTVPMMDNDPGMYQNLVNDVNVYGLSCSPTLFAYVLKLRSMVWDRYRRVPGLVQLREPNVLARYPNDMAKLP